MNLTLTLDLAKPGGKLPDESMPENPQNSAVSEGFAELLEVGSPPAGAQAGELAAIAVAETGKPLPPATGKSLPGAALAVPQGDIPLPIAPRGQRAEAAAPADQPPIARKTVQRQTATEMPIKPPHGTAIPAGTDRVEAKPGEPSLPAASGEARPQFKLTLSGDGDGPSRPIPANAALPDREAASEPMPTSERAFARSENAMRLAQMAPVPPAFRQQVEVAASPEAKPVTQVASKAETTAITNANIKTGTKIGTNSEQASAQTARRDQREALPIAGKAEAGEDAKPDRPQIAARAQQAAANPAPIQQPVQQTVQQAVQQAVTVPSSIAVEAPQQLATPSADRSASATQPAPRHDFEAVVERLAIARETAQPARADMQVTHREFGNIALQFDMAGQSLRVAMANADSGFAPAVQAAMTEAARSDAQHQRHEGQSGQNSQQGPQGQTSAQSQSDGQRQDANARGNQTRNSGLAQGRNQNSQHEQADAQSPRDGSLFA